MLPEELEDGVEPALHLVVYGARNADPAGFCDALQAGGDVHSVAVDRAVLLRDDVADVDANPKQHPLLFNQRPVSLLQRRLNLHRAAHRLHCTGKLGQHAVARHVAHLAAAAFDALPEDGAALIECVDRGGVIERHESAIALDIGGEDRGKLARLAGFAHALTSPWAEASGPLGESHP